MNIIKLNIKMSQNLFYVKLSLFTMQGYYVFFVGVSETFKKHKSKNLTIFGREMPKKNDKTFNAK